MLTRELIRRLPKAELHVHLDGSLRPATMVELAAAARVELPTSDPEQLRRYMLVDDAANLEDYLRRFDVTDRPAADARGDRAGGLRDGGGRRADRVRYLEVRYCPELSTRGGLTLDEVIEAEWRGLARGERDFGVRTGIINCSLRHYDPAVSLRIAERSVANRDRGVVGFDLAGGEAGRPPGVHRAAFDVALARRPRHHGPRRRGGRGRLDGRGRSTLPRRPDRARHPARGGPRAAGLRAGPAHPDRDQPHQQRADARRGPASRTTRCGGTSTRGST